MKRLCRLIFSGNVSRSRSCKGLSSRRLMRRAREPEMNAVETACSKLRQKELILRGRKGPCKLRPGDLVQQGLLVLLLLLPVEWDILPLVLGRKHWTLK